MALARKGRIHVSVLEGEKYEIEHVQNLLQQSCILKYEIERVNSKSFATKLYIQNTKLSEYIQSTK